LLAARTRASPLTPLPYNRGVIAPLSEFALIEQFFRRPGRDPAIVVGNGDDGAVVRPSAGCDLVLSVDMLVEGCHFLADVDPARLGQKTLAVNLSDLAAMGATPRWALLAGALPDNDEGWVRAFARGFFALADAHAVELIGGDTTRGPRNLCVTIIGDVPAGAALTRAGAKADDDIYVSGSMGAAALALAALQGRTALDQDAFAEGRARLETPQPQIALGKALRGIANAAIDVSDGVVGDLSHILVASGVGAEIELKMLPRPSSIQQKLDSAERELALDCLLAGGDDYELCFTVPRAARAQIAVIACNLGLPLTRIGSITRGDGLVVRAENGQPLPWLPRAFDHFAP